MFRKLLPRRDKSRKKDAVKLSSYVVDPTAAYEKKPSWRSTAYASVGLAVDVLKESSDVFTPLKSVAGGLSAILKYYDVRYAHFTKPSAPLTLELANDGEPRSDSIADTPDRRPCQIIKHPCSRGRDRGDTEKTDPQRVIYTLSVSTLNSEIEFRFQETGKGSPRSGTVGGERQNHGIPQQRHGCGDIDWLG